MGDIGGQILFGMGVDLSQVREAGKVVLATMGDLSRVTDQYQQKTSSAFQGQLSAIEKIAKEAVATAVRQLETSQKQTTQLEEQVGKLKEQLTENTKLLEAGQALYEQGQRRVGQLEQQLLKIREQNQEARKAGEGGLFGRAVEEIGGAALGRTAGMGLGKIVAGAGLGVFIGETAVRGVANFIEKLKEATVEASKLTIIEDVFRRVAAGAGVDATQMLEKMRQETDGLVSKLDLMKTATVGLRSPFKLTSDEIARATGAVIKLAEANGVNATQAIRRFDSALESGRMVMLSRTLGLSRFGLILNDIAPTAGRATRGILEMRNALVKIEDAARKQGDLPETLEKMGTRLSIAWKDIVKEFGKGVNVSQGFRALGTFVQGLVGETESLATAAEKLGEKAGNAFAVMLEGAKGALPAMKSLGGAFAASIQAVGNLVGGVLGGGGAGAAGGYGPSRQTVEKAVSAAHPVLTEAVRTVIGFNRVLAIAAGLLELFARKLAQATGGPAATGAKIGAAVARATGLPETVGAAGGAMAGRFFDWGKRGSSHRSRQQKMLLPGQIARRKNNGESLLSVRVLDWAGSQKKSEQSRVRRSTSRRVPGTN